MNERLAKLTEQCYEYNETMQGAWFNKTKFAVLIIQECANIALREDHDPYECILKHFGVTNAIQTN
jgi:hypothetical protein